MEWKRGNIIGRGSSAVVCAATFERDGKTERMAVKSAPVDFSSMLVREKKVLIDLGDCPQVVRFLGDDTTTEDDGVDYYNVLLERAPHASVANVLERLPEGFGVQEAYVRRWTRCMVRGLAHIHAKGYVHCDIKPGNILLWGREKVKIADFGLAKRAGERLRGMDIRGTPLYVAPEGVRYSEYEPPCDVWSLGCTVSEMITGRTAVRFPPGTPKPTAVLKIGRGEALPEIPAVLSEDGKDFLKRCLAMKPEDRWTAEMLLHHPFVVFEEDDDDEEDEEEEVAMEKKNFLLPLKKGLKVVSSAMLHVMSLISDCPVWDGKLNS